MTGEWRKLHNKELNDLYSSPSIGRFKKSRRIGEGRGIYMFLVGKPDGKRPLGRPIRKWKDNIQMDLQGVGFGSMDWIELAQDRDRWRALEKCGNELSKTRGIT